MTGYLEFRQLLLSRGLAYNFDDEAETYDVYGGFGTMLYPSPLGTTSTLLENWRGLFGT